MVGSSMAVRWLWKGVERTPSKHQRRARNWRTIRFGERIVDKYGRVTGWEVVSEPYRKNAWDKLTTIEVFCVSCGNVYARYLNDIVQGRSQRCRSCYCANRKAPQVG